VSLAAVAGTLSVRSIGAQGKSEGMLIVTYVSVNGRALETIGADAAVELVCASPSPSIHLAVRRRRRRAARGEPGRLKVFHFAE
jgi:hypothetical protein